MRFKRLKKSKISSHDHSFSPIKNPEIVLEISAVTEYVGTIFIRSLRKIKNNGFLVNILSYLTVMKNTFFISLNTGLNSLPTYSVTVDISKTISGFLIGEKLWSLEPIFGSFSLLKRTFRLASRESPQLR